jgi:hypothetical protein
MNTIRPTIGCRLISASTESEPGDATECVSRLCRFCTEEHLDCLYRVEVVLITRTTTPPRQILFNLRMSEFWSGDLGLTLLTISLVILVFIITPLREAGLPGRIVFELIVVSLMLFGTIAAQQSRFAGLVLIAFVLITAAFLGVGRFHPTPFLHQLGSILSTMTLLLYVRIVLIVMFRGGPVTWSRTRGSVSAYLLLGVAWASAFQVLEQFQPGSFHFVTLRWTLISSSQSRRISVSALSRLSAARSLRFLRSPVRSPSPNQWLVGFSPQS